MLTSLNSPPVLSPFIEKSMELYMAFRELILDEVAHTQLYLILVY